ncbi:MAG: hypothetical protein AABY22_03860, partial [Nanoarchaeota archaeon]
GGQDGTFLISTSCNNNKISLSTLASDVVREGERKTIDVIISGESTTQGETENAICTINIRDRTTSASDSCSFNVILGFATPTCQPNRDRICSVDKTEILICNEFGNGYRTFDTCGGDDVCGFADGGIQCLGEEEIEPLCGNNICDNIFENLFCSADCKNPPPPPIPAKEECEEKMNTFTGKLLGYQYIENQVGRGPFGIGAIFGLYKIEPECRATFLPYYIIGFVAIVLIGGIIFLLIPSRQVRRRRFTR